MLGDGAMLPATQTGRTIELQEFLDVVNDPAGAALAALIVALGEGLEGRGEDAAAALDALKPALTETKELLEILGAQNQLLTALIDRAEPVAQALAADRGQRLDKVVAATDQLLAATAAGKPELDAALRRLPTALATARSALGELTALAGQSTPVLASLRPLYRRPAPDRHRTAGLRRRRRARPGQRRTRPPAAPGAHHRRRPGDRRAAGRRPRRAGRRPGDAHDRRGAPRGSLEPARLRPQRRAGHRRSRRHQPLPADLRPGNRQGSGPVGAAERRRRHGSPLASSSHPAPVVPWPAPVCSAFLRFPLAVDPRQAARRPAAWPGVDLGSATGLTQRQEQSLLRYLLGTG